MKFNPEALDQSFVDWAAVESDPAFQEADNGKKMQMFDAWADYSVAYTDKRKKEAPETDLPKFESAYQQQAEWIKSTRPELAKQYTIQGMLAEEEDTNTILETLKDIDGLKSKGFSDTDIQAARKQAEDFLMPQMEAFHNNLDGLAGSGPGYTKDQLRQKIWEEPNLGDHLRNIENGLANGFTSVLLGAGQGLATVGAMTGIPGAKEAADTAREYKEMFAEQLPLDPRMNWATNAAVSGVTQAPAQLATAFATPVQITANFGQMFAEDSDRFFEAEKKDEFERRKAAGILPDETPYSAFEKSLSVKETEQMRAMANWKAIPSSLLNTVGETVSEKLALKGIPWTKIPYGKTIQKQIDNLRKANPKMAVGARMFSNTAGSSVAESLTEAAQGITSGLSEAAFYETTDAKDAFKGIAENMVGGAAGGAAMSIAPSATRAFREQSLFEDANSVVDGTAKSIVGLKAQRDAAIEQYGDDSVQAKTLQRAIDTQENEAHYHLSLVGGVFDETRAKLGQTSADAKNSFRTQLAKYIKDNQVGDFTPEKDIAREQQGALTRLRENVTRLRNGFRQNGDSTGGTLEAGLDQYEQREAARIQQEADDKRSKADKALSDFVGSVDEEGPGRAAYARVVVGQMFPNFAFSEEFQDDAVVVETLNAVEQNLITDETDLTEWLKAPAAKATSETKASATAAQPQGLMTTGQRLDAFRIAEDNLESADEPTKKEFGRLKEDIQFWNGVLNDKEASEQDKAEAAQRLPDLENALLEIATGGVSSQSTNQNDQNQAANQTTVPTQEVPATGATGEGTGTGVQTIRATNADGTQADYSQEDYAAESRGIVRALESGEMTPEAALQNVEAVRMEIEAAPELTPEQKAQWSAPFQNIPALIEQRRQQTTPAASSAPNAESTLATPESTGSSELIAGEGSLSNQPTPARMGGVSGDVVRTEAGETVFRNATDGTETVLRVKEGSIDKDPATLTVDDFESGDGTPLVSEANKQFSVLPENERLARPFFRSQPQPQDGQTAKSSGSYPEAAGSTPAPATPAPDIAAITAEVQANPDQHRSKQGNRKLVSREAAVTILSQLPETLTNKDVATLAKDSGMSSTNFRKLVALRGDQNAVGSLLNGDMDAELGLFDRATQPAAAPQQQPKVSNDTNTESTVVGQSPVDRWVNDSFAAIEQAAAELPQSSINAALFREKLTNDEGRAEIREKLGQMFNTVARNLKIADPIVREEAMEKIFRGALQKQTGEGLTSNVLQDLLTNLKKTGDPFLVKSKGGEVGYSAWLKHRNKQNEFMQAQGKRDMTETLVENEGAPTSASQGVQEEEGDGTGPAFTEGDPDIEAGRSEAKSMQREAVQKAYDRIARSLAGQYGLDRDVVKAAVARHFSDKRGVKLDFSELGWATPSKPKVDKAVAALEAAMPDIERALVAELTKAIRSAAAEANRLGLLKSDAVEISGTPTLDQIIELGVIDEIQNPDFYNALNEARESKSPEALMPLLQGVSQNDIASLQTIMGIVLNNGKQITDKKQLTSLNKADMQAVLDSDLLPVRLRQTLQALVDLSGEDGLGLVRNSKNEGFRRLAELYSEQIGNRAPVEVVFNLGLNPSVTGQGLWSAGSNRVHISPFLTREKGLMEATILHEVMHPIWDGKITNYLAGNTAGLNDKELAAITELERLFSFSKAEAQKRLDAITDPDERRIMERNLLGTTNLREFLNEALNHRPFQDFLNELTDPNADGKTSVFRTILNKILELIRGGKVSLDSVLQRAFELSTDIASSSKPLSMEQRTPSQAEYIRDQEIQKGRPLTEEEVSLAAVNYAMQNPRPRFAESQAQADQFAAEYLSDEELDAYNYDRQREGQPVLSSDMVVSDQQVYEAIKANGGITIDVWTAGQPGTGIVVAPFKETETKIPLNTFAPQDVNDFMEKFRPLLEVPGMHLGGWVSDDTVYLDVSIVTEDEVTATILAEDGNQLAAYNIGTGEFPSTPELVARNSGALAQRRSDPDFQNLARSLQQAFGRAVGGIQSADNRNVPTEGAFPEIGIIEALTGEPATQDEINRIAESAPVKAGEPDPQSTLNQYQLDASEPAGPSTGFERTGNTESGARSDYQAGQRVGENASSQTNIGRSAAASARADVTQGTELTGDGRSFADFFAKVTGNKDARFIPVNPYRPAIPLGPSATAFKAARDKYRGNFDAHIATSIPGFDEVQAVVGSALLKTFGQTGAELLDIGTSEGGLIKALADSSGGKIQSVGIDPNKAMMATFDSKPQAQGAEFSFSAFGSAEDAGKVAWREGDGTEVYTFDPKGRTFDVVHEAMVFQFISNARNAQVSRVKELMKPGGLAIFEEKFGGFADEYDAAERQKDSDWKALFFTPEQIQAKQQEVLSRGGDEIEGMTDKQVAWWEMEKVLTSNFENVVQFWSSGNFRGYAASDDLSVLKNFVSNMQPTDTVFSTQDTPREIRESKKEEPLESKAVLGPEDKFTSYNQVINYVEKEYGPKFKALKSEVRDSVIAYDAAYKVIDERGNRHYMLYNPLRQIGRTRNQVDSIMREEMIHAASGLVLMRKGIEWVEFYDDLGSSLSSAQRSKLKAVYRSTRDMKDVGAEYFRAAIQKLLYGTITETEMRETPMKKIVALLKDFVSYFRKKLVDPVVRDVYEDTVRILQKIDKKNAQQDPELAVLNSVSVPYKEAVDKSLRNVIDKAVAEPAQAAFLKPEEFNKAAQSLAVLLKNPDSASVKARGGRAVNLNSPDDSTARKLEKATGQRWDRRLLDARVIHALTESDRTTPNANKIASAPMVPQTLRQADFVARTDFEGRPFLVFAKLYNDPESPTGVRWHFVEAREDTGAFETQYSDTDPQRGRAMAAKVIGIGDATPKKKRTPTEAGYAQELSGDSSSKPQGIGPDVSSNQGEVLDNTNVESVQNKILEEITNLTDKQNRLAQSGDSDGAKLVGDQINELTAQFDQLLSAPVSPEQDASYLSAVERGDMETAQRMVDEAAQKAGFNEVGWHGSTSDPFTVFRTDSTATTGWRGLGAFFGGEEQAGGFGSRPQKFYLRLQNTLNTTYSEIMDRFDDPIEARQQMIAEGYDSVSPDPYAGAVAVFSPDQIKSADPVTRDDAGKVLPLSKRFNPQNPDIRFSAPVSGPEAILSTIDRVLDLPERPEAVETSPFEGGKVRSIAKIFAKSLGAKNRIEFGDVEGKRAVAKISKAGDRIFEVLRRAAYEFPNFASWYESRLKMALQIFTELDPDVANKNNQSALLVTLAITSNGADVATQTEDAWDVYKFWKQSGKLAGAPEKRGAMRGGEVEEKLALADALAQKIGGYEKLGEFLNRKGTVAELRTALQNELGLTKKESEKITNGELINEVVPFSLIFGAKLGSFFNNMSGDFSTITMDRWFMRTFGRAMGTQLSTIAKESIEAKKTRLEKALKEYTAELLKNAGIENAEADPEKTAAALSQSLLKKARVREGTKDLVKVSVALADYFVSEENRKGLSETEHELRRAANALFKIGDGLELNEAPDGGSHRRWIRAVMADAINKFNQQTDKPLVPAEAQALLWYYEKLIHETYGSRQKDASPDYGSGANRLYIRERGTQSPSYRDSDGIKRRSGGGRSAAFGGDQALSTTDESQEDTVIQSAPVAPFQGNVVPGFNASVYTPASSRNTEALKRVLTDPDYRSVQAVLSDKRYFAWTEKETLAKANEFIDALKGDLQDAYNKSATTYGITPEQTILIRGLALKKAQSAANVARAELANPNTPVARRVNLQFIAQHYSDMAENFAEDLMETASLAGQELRSFRLLADALSPQSWVKTYKRAATRSQRKKFEKDEVLREMMDRIKEARRIAASSTTARMQKALDFAAKRFLPEGASDEEIKAHTDFARVMANQLPVRDAVVQAAVERTVIDGLETIRRSIAPEEQVPESFLRDWENRLRSIASEQINAIIEERLTGGQVDTEATPELSDNEKEAMRQQKVTDAWRQFSDFPISETVFSLAKATLVASDSPYANLVRRAQFDPTRIKKLREAVKLSIDTSNEIQLSVGERRMTVESLKLRLSEANPNLNEAQLAKLAEAVEAVYNEEVGRATRLALDGIVRKHAEKQTAKKIAKDNDFTSRLLPLVNMGAFSDEAAYNAIAERLRLPSWNPDTAADIEAKARALQELPEDSIQRQEASVQLMSDILKANIKEARGMQNFGPLMQISSALWSAGILSAPPTQIVNASMSTVSVFLESLMEATGYWYSATRKGVSQQQARAYFGDMARAWLFAFGKDANNTSLRAVNEAFGALTKGQSKFKSEKLENMSPLEMFKFDPRVAIPGNKMMEAIISGEGKAAIKEAAKMAVGVPMVMAERVWNRDAKGAVKDYMATMKLVGRFMLAADAMNSYGATATKEMMMRRHLAQQEGMSPQEIEKVMREAREGGNEAVRDAAIAQVENEAQRGDFGPAGSKSHEVAKARRLEQLIETQTYGAETVNAGRDFAAMATFNSDPYGVVGWLMDTLFAGPTKVLGIVTKPINPFPKTMSNLINAAINYTPYGSLRAEGWNLGTAIAKSDRYPQQFLREAPERGTPEYYSLHARSIAGTAAMGVLYMMIMSAVKDREEGKEPWFEVHGPGPSDPKARKQFRDSGAKPFSLRIGKVVVNYTDWPGFNLALGAFGTLYDQMVYSDVEMELSEWAMQTIRAVALTTLNRAALGGASALFEVLSPSVSDEVAESRLKQLASSYATGFTRPSFIRWAETIATGQRQETRTDQGWLLSMAPVVSVFRGRPALNILGEPLETSKWDATAGRVVTTQGTHPVLTPLTNAQLWINPPESYKIFDPSKPAMVRDITEAEFYDYSKAYGETLSSILTPKQAEYLAEMAKTAPNTAQETLNGFTRMAADIAKAKLAGRGLAKGKEIKGP